MKSIEKTITIWVEDETAVLVDLSKYEGRYFVTSKEVSFCNDLSQRQSEMLGLRCAPYLGRTSYELCVYEVDWEKIGLEVHEAFCERCEQLQALGKQIRSKKFNNLDWWTQCDIREQKQEMFYSYIKYMKHLFEKHKDAFKISSSFMLEHETGVDPSYMLARKAHAVVGAIEKQKRCAQLEAEAQALRDSMEGVDLFYTPWDIR